MDPRYSRQAVTLKTDRYNVYAKSFIPVNLKQVNEEPGQVCETAPRHYIDYPKYISSFAGSSFLPPRPPYPTPTRSHPASLDGPDANGYLEHFATIWQTEIAAQEEENQQFALYNVHCWRTFSNTPVKPSAPRGQGPSSGLFTISVPGLKEDIPYVELGDTLELRQLLLDQYNNFIGEKNGFQQGNWTRVIYQASVHGVYRAEELVYLKVDGLNEALQAVDPYARRPIKANVTFPLKKRPLHACRDALVFIHHALGKAIGLERRMLDQSEDIDGQQYLVKEMANHVIEADEMRNQAPSASETSMDPLNNAWIRRMLFPVDSDGRLQTALRSVPQRALFDSQVNYEQAHAVNSVCLNDYGCLPYLISGPPGTGKTKTIVETAMQLLNSNIADHILICAPSESAADTLALRLKKYLDTAQLLRLNGPWRADNEVAAGIMQHTYMEDDMFTLPPIKQFMAYNIVVTSCRDAAILVEARLTNTDLWTLEQNMLDAFHPNNNNIPSKLHWGALLLDEAAQGTELDVLSSICAVCPPTEYPISLPQPRFVMAGDEKQLGPKTASHDPQFSRSLFGRLFDRPIYKNHPLSRTNTKPSTGPPVLRRTMLPILYPPFTNLIRNYRSHPAILSVPSNLFYADTLIPEAPTPDTPLQASHLWHGTKWPVLFVPHCYIEDIERDDGGWYNAQEARLACDIAAHLVAHDVVAQSDIAIIAPFAAQVKRIRATIRTAAYGLWDVNIGPLEAFQGLEKRVVIIATTRTRGKHFVERDVEKSLGLIHQPRKLNVALTRAKEGLIVLGSASALYEDDHWREFLAFCWRNELVKDETGWWVEKKNKYESANVARVGVLEKALLASQNRARSSGAGRVLGGRAIGVENGYDGSYEAWVESLREAMDEEVDLLEEQEDDGAGKGAS